MRIIVDLDGTIFDTQKRQYRVYLDSMAAVTDLDEFDCPPLEGFWRQKRAGQTTVDTLPSSFPESGVEEFKEEWRKRIERRKYLQLDEVFPGALSALDDLGKLNTQLILVTHRSKENNARWELKRRGIYSRFDGTHIVPHGQVPKAEYMDAKIGGLSTSDIVIGDSEKDMKLANQFGAISIAVTSGIRSEDKLIALEPEYIVPHISEAVGPVSRVADNL